MNTALSSIIDVNDIQTTNMISSVARSTVKGQPLWLTRSPFLVIWKPSHAGRQCSRIICEEVRSIQLDKNNTAHPVREDTWAYSWKSKLTETK